jgi:hypothetical protein
MRLADVAYPDVPDSVVGLLPLGATEPHLIREVARS